MKCPHDGTALQPVHVGRIALDKCHTCDGLWCDQGELETIRKTDATGIEAGLEEVYGNPEVTRLEIDGHMRCPRCESGRLNAVNFSIASPMRIDRCDTCFGHWLDAGELDRALGPPKSEEETPDSRLTMVLRSVSKLFA